MAILIEKAEENKKPVSLAVQRRRKEMKMKKQNEAVMRDDVIEAIKRAFVADLETEEIELSDYNRGKSPFEYGYSFEGEGANNRESEWVVFTSEDDAYNEAYQEVKQDLEIEPEIFNQDWLSNFIMISETDKRIMAGEEADYYLEDLSDEEKLEEANLAQDYLNFEDQIEEINNKIDELDNEMSETEDQITQSKLTDEIIGLQSEITDLEEEKEKLVQEAEETIRDERYNYIKDALDDPIEYFVNETGIYSKEDLFKTNFVQLDIEKATEEALNVDGTDHFLDRYDGGVEEITDPETGNTFYAYGTN